MTNVEMYYNLEKAYNNVNALAMGASSSIKLLQYLDTDYEFELRVLNMLNSAMDSLRCVLIEIDKGINRGQVLNDR